MVSIPECSDWVVVLRSPLWNSGVCPRLRLARGQAKAWQGVISDVSRRAGMCWPSVLSAMVHQEVSPMAAVLDSMEASPDGMNKAWAGALGDQERGRWYRRGGFRWRVQELDTWVAHLCAGRVWVWLSS
jgi:hypothetical protein